jgi:hypothetical protein
MPGRFKLTVDRKSAFQCSHPTPRVLGTDPRTLSAQTKTQRLPLHAYANLVSRTDDQTPARKPDSELRKLRFSGTSSRRCNHSRSRRRIQRPSQAACRTRRSPEHALSAVLVASSAVCTATPCSRSDGGFSFARAHCSFWRPSVLPPAPSPRLARRLHWLARRLHRQQWQMGQSEPPLPGASRQLRSRPVKRPDRGLSPPVGRVEPVPKTRSGPRLLE